MRKWLLSTILLIATGCEFSHKLKIKQFNIKDERQKLVAIENLMPTHKTLRLSIKKSTNFWEVCLKDDQGWIGFIWLLSK